MVARGEVWWADLAEPRGSEPGYRRPVLVVQGDAFNESSIATVICVALTSNMKWADMPGNVQLTENESGLPKRSVANVSQLVTVDRGAFDDFQGRIPRRKLNLVLNGIDVVLGR